MKKFAAITAAVIIILNICAAEASAAEYGRNPYHTTAAAQGEFIYYYEDGAIWAFNVMSGKKRTVCETENAAYICAMGNYLYYHSFTYRNDYVYKVDIGSGKQTKIFESADKTDETYIDSIITSGNRIYISLCVFSEHNDSDMNDLYYVDIYDANDKYLDNFTPRIGNSGFFTDGSDCEVCIAFEEIIYSSGECSNAEELSAKCTNVYNIVKIRSDFPEEKITIPAKIGKNVKTLIYCDEKYVYYIDNNNRLCRYNTKTEKYAVLVDGSVRAAYYKDEAVYFFTSGNELKKYEHGSISTIQNIPGKRFFTVLFFFDDYMFYYNYGTDTYKVIDYNGNELISVENN